MNARRCPIDIAAVKAYGIPQWRLEFSWPVADREFIALATAIEARVREMIARIDGDIGAAFLIARDLPIAVEHILHARTVVARLHAAGITPVWSPNARWYGDASSVQPIRYAALFGRAVTPGQPSIARRSVRWWREIATNATFPKVAARFRKGRHGWLYGSAHELLAEHLARTPEWIATSYADVHAPIPEFSSAPAIDIHVAASAFADQCARDAGQYGFSCDANAVIMIRNIAVASLRRAVWFLQRARTQIERHGVVHGYLSGASNVEQRASAIAIRERGGHVTSVAHGGFVGLFNTAMLSYSEFALSDTYVTYTPGSAQLCERIQRVHPAIAVNDCRIVSGDSNVYRPFRDAMRRSVPRRIRTVMVIGFPQNANRKSTGAAAFGLIQLDLELRIIDILHTAGYDVVYKAHPDRLSEVRGIFEGRAAVLEDDFRVVWDRADAYVFGCMRTSAFALALCTQKPIVAFLMEDEPAVPFPDALAFLTRRVAMIRTTVDDRARVRLDPSVLTDALAYPADPTDTEFFDRYLATPTGV